MSNPIIAKEVYGQRAAAQKNRWRKSCIAACCQMLERQGCAAFELLTEREDRVSYAKGVIERAAGVGSYSFNKIGVTKLRALANAFNKTRKMMDAVIEVAIEEMTGKEEVRHER